MKIIKLKKKVKILLIFSLFLIIILMILKYPKNYKINYRIKDSNITEQYIKNNKQYIIKVKDGDLIYEYSFKHNYISNKKVIQSINKNNTCIKPLSKKLKLYTLCYDKNNDFFYYKNQEQKYKTKKFKQLIFNKTKKVYVWNHKGYTILNTNKKINLFKNEIYYNDLAYKYNSYLITPDYEKKNRFSKFYIINLSNSKVLTIKSKYKISYDYYYLGAIKDTVYIVDKRTKKEYGIDLNKKNIFLATNNNDDGKIWNGKWEDISMIKLSSKEQSFKRNNIYNYYIKNNKLFVTYNLCSNKTLITNKKIDKVLFENNDEIYYLVKNKVFYSSPYLKDVFILEYDELEFNSDNQVFLS